MCTRVHWENRELRYIPHNGLVYIESETRSCAESKGQGMIEGLRVEVGRRQERSEGFEDW